MDRLFQQLKDLQGSKPLAKKVLLTQSRRKGNIILKRLALSGVSLTNFSASTIGDLVELLMGTELAAAGLTVISDIQKTVIVEEILLSLPPEGHLARARIEPGLIASVVCTIDELRLNDIDLEAGSLVFTSAEKVGELSLITRLYAERLKTGRWVDEASVLTMALAGGQKAAAGITACILPDVSLHSLQSLFIEGVLADKVELSTVKPKGLRGSSYQTEEESRGDDEYYLADIFAPSGRKIDQDRITISHAVGIVNEVRGVLRHIIASGEPVDAYEIACPSNSDYHRALTTEAVAQGLAISSGWGRSLGSLRPVCALISILRWLSSGCKDTELYGSINAGYFLFTKDGSKTKTDYHITRALRMSGIGWGRARYGDFINKDMSHYQRQEDREAAKDLQSLLGGLLEIIPEGFLASNLTVADLASLCLDLLGAVIFDEDTDNDAMDSLIYALNELATHDKIPRQPGSAIMRLIDRLVETGIDSQSPRPGRIYISSLSEPGLSGREHLMLLGLNEGEFPGNSGRDPILTDDERESLGLPATKQKLSDALYLGASSLAAHTGSLWISYQTFDLTGWQDKAPASLALQALRLKTGKPEALYSDLTESVGEPMSFRPGHDSVLLDTTDWWLARPYDAAGKQVVSKATCSLFESIIAGETAYCTRKTKKFTVYDGRIEVRKSDSPGKPLMMSASKLEGLAKCPRKYFFANILYARPIDATPWDPSLWLDSMKRGALLHSAYCLYYREIRDRHYKSDIDRELILGIINKLAADYLKQIPCPSESIYMHELDGLEDEAMAFLDYEARASDDRCPVFFELTFGQKLHTHGDYGIDKPVTLDFYRKRPVVFKGSIDRVDQDKNNDYIVIDYKTGKASSFLGDDITTQCDHLQWALYMIAAKAIFKELDKDKHDVIKAEYYFPTRLGKGLRFPVEAGQLDMAKDIITDLLDILEEGLFLPHEESDCDYCDWTDACHTIRSKWDKGPGDEIKNKHECDESIGRCFLMLRGKGDE